MTADFRLLLLVVFALCGEAFATDSAIVATNPPCPFRLEGVIRMEGRELSKGVKAKVSIRNDSGMDAVLIITQIAAKLFEDGRGDSPEDHETNLMHTRSDDFFFDNDGLRRNEVDSWEGWVRPATLNESISNLRIHATGQVVFVQYADGSICGDPKIASDTFLQRKRTLKALEHLRAIYEQGNADKFAEELMKTATEPLILGLQRAYEGQKTKDPSSIYQIILERLAAAARNQRNAVRNADVSNEGN